MNTTDSFIRDCYRHFLFREPGAQEAVAWQKLLDSSSISNCRIPERFKSSPEFHALRSTLANSKIGLLHLPKTAGTSFQSWLRALYFENEIFEYGRAWNPDTTQAKLVCGHVHLSFLRDSGCTHSFTILRDPTERLISLYRFGRSLISGWPADDPVNTLSFEDWLRCTDPRARAHQDGFYATVVLTEDAQTGQSQETLLSRALQRYGEFTAVGIQEELPSFFARVAGALGIPPPLGSIAHNTAEGNTSLDPDYPERPHLSETCRALLAEITKLDRAIYDHIRKEVITLTSSPGAGKTSQAKLASLIGRISATNSPSQVSGAFELRVVIKNESESAWHSDAPDSIKVCCRWFDAEWQALAHGPDVFALPSAGVPARSSKEMGLSLATPEPEGPYHLLITLVHGEEMLLVSKESFTPLVLDFEVSQTAGNKRPTRRSQPVIICAYLHDADVAKVRNAFGLDEEHGKKLDFFFWKDSEQVGPEQAFQHCWKQFPDRDVILVHPDMAPLPDDASNRWYDELLDHVARLPQAGIIGCDLLFPGKLPAGGYGVQCAGGLFDNSTISHIAGRNMEYSDDLRRPREVAWATFAGVYIRRSTIDACGDLDPVYQWAYVGDVDYCFEARRRGIEVYQVPVNLLHAENGTTATFLQQEEYRTKANENVQRFHEKWRESALYSQEKPGALGKKPELFLVLGMHRSGTSLLARLLQCLGAPTTERLVDPMPDNPKGFFEDRDIYEFHERVLLPALGVTWDSVQSPDWTALDGGTGRALQEKALHILQRNYHRDQAAWTIKDPRFMILLPFWLPLLERMFGKIHLVLALRNPHAVGASLHRRNGLSAKHAEDLFAHYWLSALSSLSLEKCARVDFADLVSDPGGVLGRIANHCSRRIDDVAAAKLEGFQHEFFDPSLVHSAPEPQRQESNSLSSLLHKALSPGADLTARGLPDEIAQALCDYQAESRKTAKLFTQLAEELARQLPTLR